VTTTQSTTRVIAVTGTIGSGKSAVLGLFAEYGLRTISADAVARDVVAPGTPGLDEVVATFGDHVLDETGSLNRARLAQIVFSDDRYRRQLEEITHPRIRAVILAFVAACVGDGEPAVVIEIPLLTPQSVHDYMIDDVVVVRASAAVSFERLVQRRGLDPDDAAARLRAQASQGIGQVEGRWYIENDGDLASLRNQVVRIVEEIKDH
jgi:dephospho-CoA kinase